MDILLNLVIITPEENQYSIAEVYSKFWILNSYVHIQWSLHCDETLCITYFLSQSQHKARQIYKDYLSYVGQVFADPILFSNTGCLKNEHFSILQHLFRARLYFYYFDNKLPDLIMGFLFSYEQRQRKTHFFGNTL